MWHWKTERKKNNIKSAHRSLSWIQDEELRLMRLNALSYYKNCFATVKLRTADR